MESSLGKVKILGFVAWACCCAGLASPGFGQSFNCVLLNEDNTDIFTDPLDCYSTPENAIWCNCARSLFTHPVKGEKSGFNQAVQWIVDRSGIGNHRVEVPAGTLDLSGVQAGQVIGETVIDELIPKEIGPPIGGTFFTVKSKVVVTAAGTEALDFDVIVTEVSLSAKFVLDYEPFPSGSPLDAVHSNGLFYRGRLSKGPGGNGFILEYRYPAELVVPENDPATPLEYISSPAIEISDADTPGFTVRFLMKFFTTEAGIFTLPGDNQIPVTTTLRRFTASTLNEILPLSDPDLCQVIDDPDPCKTIEETLQIKTSAGENSPPTAIIKMIVIDAQNDTLTLLPDPALVFMRCGEALIIFRGADSDDGDGGIQQLSYEWSIIEGPEGGAAIPPDTKNFKDTEISFTVPGTYKVGMRVNDGQSANNTDETSVRVDVDDSLDFNVQPTAVIKTSPDPAAAELVNGTASVALSGMDSANGDLGIDDCLQTLTYRWSEVSSPRPDKLTFADPATAETTATFTYPGDYIIELEVNDGQPVDNLGTAEVLVAITGAPAGGIQRPGDFNQDGQTDLSDAVNLLGHLFLGNPSALPCDSPNVNTGSNQLLLNFNGQGDTDITDAINILQRLFLGGLPHVLGEACTVIAGCPSNDQCK